MIHPRVLCIVFVLLFPNLLLAEFTPSINIFNKLGIKESEGYEKYTRSVKVVQGFEPIYQDVQVDTLQINAGSGRVNLNLNGHRLTVGVGGIEFINTPYQSVIAGAGTITSNQSILGIHLNFPKWGGNYAYIDSAITDNGNKKVGLRVNGGGHLIFISGRSNTFTGDVEVDDTILSLGKENGAIAVRGDIFLKNHAELHLDKSYQFSKTSNITMTDSKLAFSGHLGHREEHFKKMKIMGKSELDFHLFPEKEVFKRVFYLDDLMIDTDGQLNLIRWREGLHRLLVRKDSRHLYESLARIVFEHDKTKKAGLRDYNKDYWEIGPGFPEPATYGTILSAATLGLSFYRKRKNAAKYIRCAR